MAGDTGGADVIWSCRMQGPCTVHSCCGPWVLYSEDKHDARKMRDRFVLEECLLCSLKFILVAHMPHSLAERIKVKSSTEKI